MPAPVLPADLEGTPTLRRDSSEGKRVVAGERKRGSPIPGTKFLPVEFGFHSIMHYGSVFHWVLWTIDQVPKKAANNCFILRLRMCI